MLKKTNHATVKTRVSLITTDFWTTQIVQHSDGAHNVNDGITVNKRQHIILQFISNIGCVIFIALNTKCFTLTK